MKYTYTYNGTTYLSSYSIRRAIFESEHKVFGAIPTEGKVEFWKNLGVQYTEIEDNPAVQLEAKRREMLAQLDSLFERWREYDAVLVSSLGFTIDADNRAMLDIAGLTARGTDSVFMDADNNPHYVTGSQLKILQGEIITSAEYTYNEKWQLRTAIESATTIEQLNNIVIVFHPADFTATTDEN